LTRTVDLAVGLGLVGWREGVRLELSASGQGELTAIDREADLLSAEKEFLAKIPRKVSAQLVSRLVGGR
jgi:hypothetical protein